MQLYKSKYIAISETYKLRLTLACALALWILLLSILLPANAQIEIPDPTSPPLDVPLVNVPFDTTNIPEPVPPPAVVRDFFELDPFYQQWINVKGFPVIASAKVSPYALKEAAWVIGQMLGHRPDVLTAMAQNKIRLSVIAYNEIVCDIPEHKKNIDPDFCFFPEVRARASFCAGCLTVTANEENLLHYHPGGLPPHSTSVVLIHEFAHGLHISGLNTVDPSFDNRLRTTYQAAMQKGLWQGSYAASNMAEYWAEATGSWFNAAFQGNSIKTRTALKKYDPDLAILLTEVFGDQDWRSTLFTDRMHLPHLQGFNPENSPIFERDPESVKTYEQLWDPDSNGDGRWMNWDKYELSELPRLLRDSSNQENTGRYISFFLVNLSGIDVSIYRVDGNGRESFIYRSSLKNINEFNTHVGAIFLVKDRGGKNLTVFRAGEKIGRIFVGKTVPITGAYLFIRQPHGLPREEFTIEPGAFAILLPGGQPSLTGKTDFNNYFSVTGRSDLPNLANFFRGGGRIELISHPSLNPLPSGTRRAKFGDVVISEIMWGLDGASPERQYIELYNASSHTYSFTDGDLLLRFSQGSEEPLPDDTFSPPYNPDSEGIVVDRMSNKGWRLSGSSGNTSKGQSLISMHRKIDYELGNVPDGTLADSWQASMGRVNLPAPMLGTPGDKHRLPSDLVSPVDVNGDGLLNVLDLVLIAVNFGKTGKNPADVNGDGVVNIVDLIKVAGEMGAAGAAPAAHPQTLEILTAADVQHWLAQAQQVNLTDVTSQRGILMLRELLASLIPKETSLLPNYPNPFNPETWIPYQLAQNAEVTLTIYAADGRVVRTLGLGQQPAGMYRSKSRAAYWDGENEVGEPVASGIYFYTLTAGDFTATRKMLIQK